MIKVSVLYPNAEGVRFDMDYYVDKHMTMVKRVLGEAMTKFEIDEGLDRKSTRLNSSHIQKSRMPSSA